MNSAFFKYLILCLALTLTTAITNKALNFKNLLYNSLSEQLTSQQLQRFFEMQEKWQWVNLVFVLLMVLIKTSLIASILYIGIYFFSKIPVTFKQLWSIVVKAEFVFLLVGIFKIGWFCFFQTNYTLVDIQYFYPLSALNITGYKDLEPWFIYPLQTLNLFELSYWLILAYFIGKATETNMDSGLKIVAYSYGSSLFLWTITIMFFILNFS